MDPATGFAVACGVIQLIEFGLSTATRFREIYKSRSALTNENDNLDSEVTHLNAATCSLAARLNDLKTTNPLNKDQKRLHQISYECEQLSWELLSRIDKPKIQGHLRKRDVPA